MTSDPRCDAVLDIYQNHGVVMAADRRLGIDGELLSAWRRMPPLDLAAVIDRAFSLSHSLLASPDGSNRQRVPFNRIIASLAMERYAGSALFDAGWTIVAHAALGGDRFCQTLLVIELTDIPLLHSEWERLRPAKLPARKIDLRDREFLRRRSRIKR